MGAAGWRDMPEAYCLGSTALVSRLWLHALVHGSGSEWPEFEVHETLAPDEIRALLAQRQAPAGWGLVRIAAHARRPNHLVQPLPAWDARAVSEAADEASPDWTQTLSYVFQSNFVNAWKEAHKSRPGAREPGAGRGRQVALGDEHDVVLLDVLRRLYPEARTIFGDIRAQSLARDDPEGPRAAESPVHCVPAYAVVVEAERVLVIQADFSFSVHQAVTYSPNFFQESLFHPLFIIFQIVKAMRDWHSRGLSIGGLNLEDVLIGRDSLITIRPDVEANLVHLNQSQVPSGDLARNWLGELRSVLAAMNCPSDIVGAHQVDTDTVLAHISTLWLRGRVSNFDYLMVLNYLSGRSFDNPYHYPVIPWVKDFSSEIGGWRDLSKSKFRLNKGDTQLDLTYNSLTEMQREAVGTATTVQPPHHVTEVLSEITYYVYKARRTSKAVLCKHVRNRWVPAEYPSSMERLQEWTPDECIPDFFTRPDIFKSMHLDLLDLGVPEWCASPEDFVVWHRNCLESPQVSEKLHHWIDLTFGCKLTGTLAVRAKNVCLDLVNRQEDLRGQGVVQLFTTPHPIKSNSNPFWRKSAPRIDVYLRTRSLADTSDGFILRNSSKTSMQEYVESSEVISLPKDYDPVQKLRETEARLAFAALPMPDGSEDRSARSSFKDLAVKRIVQDMQVLGCLILELYQPKKFVRLGPNPGLQSRFRVCSDIMKYEKTTLPYVIVPCLERLIRPEFQIQSSDRFPAISEEGLPPPSPIQFLNPTLSPMAFPRTFPVLARVLRFVHRLEFFRSCENTKDTFEERELAIGELKVKVLAKEMGDILELGEFESVGMILPLFKDMFSSPSSSVQSAWYLFDPLAKLLGPQRTREHLLELIVKIYEGNASTSKHLKLYHRTFLQFLIVRFGTKSFLANFSTYLIEAVGGYKDYDDEPAHLPREGLERDWDGPDGIKESESGEPMARGELLAARSSLSSDQMSLDGSLAEGEVFSFDHHESEKPTISLDPIARYAKDHASKGLIYIPSVSQSDRDSLKVSHRERRHPSGGGNIAQVASESVLWLSHRLGAVLTAKYLSRNLLRMLNLCFMSPESFAPVSENHADHPIRIGTQKVHGDLLVQNVLECLSQIACLYGDQMILLQYLPYTWDLIAVGKKKLTANLEGGLLGSIALLHHIIPYLSDSLLMNELQDNLLGNILIPVLQLTTSNSVSFVLGSCARRSLLYKFLDVVYLIGLRIGEEMSRTHITPLCSAFFSACEQVWTSNGLKRLECETNPILAELAETLTERMTYSAYVAFYNLMGRSHLDESIVNLNCVKVLCLAFQESGDPLPRPVTHRCLRGMTYESSPSSGHKIEFSSSTQLGGGRGSFVLAKDDSFNLDLHNLIAKDVPNTTRHLRGNWLAYWEHEIGRADRDGKFSLKQIKLQSFVGHQGAIRSIFALDNENSFLSGSRDKTVKVWSLRSQGDGTANVACQWTYPNHKKTVYSVFFKERLRHAVSHDSSSIHVWDPFVGRTVFQLEGQPIHSIADFPAPSSQVVTVSQDSVIHLIDCRQGQLVTDLKVSTGTSGLVRTLQVVPNGSEILLGHSSGYVTLLDVRTGKLRLSWKAHEGEVLNLTTNVHGQIITTSLDQTVSVWSGKDGKLRHALAGAQEPVHCVGIMGSNLVTGSTANRIGVRHGFTADSPFQVNKLRAEIIRTNLTALTILPNNRLLLLGQESGNVSLIC